MEKVLLIDISVSSESEAHRVFVTMNDRGLRLGAIELLKGFILSKITSPEDSQECHQVWVKPCLNLETKIQREILYLSGIYYALNGQTLLEVKIKAMHW